MIAIWSGVKIRVVSNITVQSGEIPAHMNATAPSHERLSSLLISMGGYVEHGVRDHEGTILARCFKIRWLVHSILGRKIESGSTGVVDKYEYIPKLLEQLRNSSPIPYTIDRLVFIDIVCSAIQRTLRAR